MTDFSRSDRFSLIASLKTRLIRFLLAAMPNLRETNTPYLKLSLSCQAREK